MCKRRRGVVFTPNFTSFDPSPPPSLTPTPPVIAFLLEEGICKTVDEAMHLVKSKRDMVMPNRGFLRQLHEIYDSRRLGQRTSVFDDLRKRAEEEGWSDGELEDLEAREKAGPKAAHLDKHFSDFPLKQGLHDLMESRAAANDSKVSFLVHYDGREDLRIDDVDPTSTTGLQLKSLILHSLCLEGGFQNYAMDSNGQPFHSRDKISNHPAVRIQGSPNLVRVDVRPLFAGERKRVGET